LDHHLGVPLLHSRMSQATEGQLALLSVHLPYAEGQRVDQALRGHGASRMSAQRVVQRWGPRRQALAGPPHRERTPRRGPRYVTADGVLIPLRGEGWQEAKVGAVYEVDEHREAREVQ
jgi:hypothetical protein